ncbi:MAG: asparagine--tRNA ligase [Candidatus Thermoplasmatota archaeon]|jgi:asparaginyl-tRNA synthetase|nr:asparagine--tRNA ligase [Candidatus Thermoplasmatota archaeon]
MQNINSVLSANDSGKQVEIRGWVYRIRTGSKICFIILRDSSNIIQCVGKLEDLGREKFDQLASLTIESSMEIKGSVHVDSRAITGYELKISSFTIFQRNDNFPVSKDISEEFELDNRHLWIRSREFNAKLKIRSTIFQAFRDFFIDNGYYEVQAPLMVSTATEGGSTLFKVPFFGEEAFLSQSSQFYLETFIFSLEKVFTVSPSFRAEKSRTWRHLTEYWHAEVEVAWADNNEMMEIEEKMIQHIVRMVLEKNNEELHILGRDIKVLEDSLHPFQRMKYSQLIEKSSSYGMPLKYGDDLGADEEKQIMSNFTRPLFLTHFPEELKTFYHRPDPQNPNQILCHDLLAPEGYGEIIGGGERIWNYDELVGRIEKNNLKKDDYYWYLDLRKYGSIPHSGFGLGLDRLAMWIMHLGNIKDAIPYPRTVRRLKP